MHVSLQLKKKLIKKPIRNSKYKYLHKKLNKIKRDFSITLASFQAVNSHEWLVAALRDSRTRTTSFMAVALLDGVSQ